MYHRIGSGEPQWPKCFTQSEMTLEDVFYADNGELEMHPETDVEKIDVADMVEILPASGDGSGEPSQEKAQTGTKRKESTTTTTTGESDGKVSSPEKKKKKALTATKTRMYEASTSAPVSGDAAPAPTLPQLAPMVREQERHLVRIKETITREYYFDSE